MTRSRWPTASMPRPNGRRTPLLWQAGWTLRGRTGWTGWSRRISVRLDRIRPDQLVDQLSIRAIVVPSIDDVTEARLEPVPRQFALRHLAVSTLAQSELDGPVSAELMASLANDVPAYQLHMPRDPDRSVEDHRVVAGSTAPAGGDNTVTVTAVPASASSFRYMESTVFARGFAEFRAQNAERCEVIVVDDGCPSTPDEMVKGILSRRHHTAASQCRSRCSAQLRCGRPPMILLPSSTPMIAGPVMRSPYLLRAFADAPHAEVVQGHVRRFETSASGKERRLGGPYLGFNVGARPVRRDTLLACGLFDESLRVSEDVDLLLRMHERGVRRLLIRTWCWNIGAIPVR